MSDMKKILSLLIIAALLFSGCGKDKEAAPEPTPAAQQSAPQWAEPVATPEPELIEPTPEPTAEPTPEPTPVPTAAPLSIRYENKEVNSITARPDKTLQLQVELPAGAPALTYESSNGSVASVDENGLVTTLTEGSADITCRAGEEYIGICKITVAKPPKPKISICFLGNPVYDFTMNASSSETLQLKAVVSPSDTEDLVIWSVSDPSVADVSPEGLVTALSEGSAKIICNVGEGKAECWVRVRGQRPAYIPVEDAVIAEDQSAIVVTYAGFISTDITIAEGQSLDLNYEFKNMEPQAVSWSTADPNVVAIDQNGTVTGLKAGKYTTIYVSTGTLMASCIVRVS